MIVAVPGATPVTTNEPGVAPGRTVATNGFELVAVTAVAAPDSVAVMPNVLPTPSVAAAGVNKRPDVAVIPPPEPVPAPLPAPLPLPTVGTAGGVFVAVIPPPPHATAESSSTIDAQVDERMLRVGMQHSMDSS